MGKSMLMFWAHLNFLELFHVEAHLVERLLAEGADAEVDHGVGQRAAHVKLHRQVVHALWILAVVLLLRLVPPSLRSSSSSNWNLKQGRDKGVCVCAGDPMAGVCGVKRASKRTMTWSRTV